MLQNCHLLLKWMLKLEAKIETFTDPEKPISEDFRLWLTTNVPGPSEEFPLGLLQNALKIVTEPPDGLKLNIKSLISKIDDERLEQCEHFAFKPLIYVICFFHAIVQDRRKYKKLGWNIHYAFNESDFNISIDLLGMYLQKSLDNKDDSIPWDSLRYLIG